MQSLLTRLGRPGHVNVRWLGWVAVTGLVLVALLAPASTALSNDTPGNNGTVKIHEGAGETEPGEVRNEPHVCTFHLHFYFSDPEQAGTWEIQEWAPDDKGTVVLSGTYDTQGDGEDRQPEAGVYTLPDGHYKLFWDGDLDTQKHDKMKVFWVDCAPTTTTTSSESTSVGSTTETTTSGSTTFTGTTTSDTGVGGTTTTTTSGGSTTTGASTSTTTEFSQTVSGTTTSAGAGPTLPNTATATQGPTGSAGSALSLVAAALAFLVGGFLLLTPSRAAKRE